MNTVVTHTRCGVDIAHLYGVTVHHHKYDAAGMCGTAHAKVQGVVFQTWGQNQRLVTNIKFRHTQTQTDESKEMETGYHYA